MVFKLNFRVGRVFLINVGFLVLGKRVIIVVRIVNIGEFVWFLLNVFI